MRKQFLQVATRYAAQKAAPWAAKIVKACGGYWAFESEEDYKVFKQQK